MAGLALPEILLGLAPRACQLIGRHVGAVAIVLDLVRRRVAQDGHVAEEAAERSARDVLLHGRGDARVAAVLPVAPIAVEDRVRAHAVVRDVVPGHAFEGLRPDPPTVSSGADGDAAPGVARTIIRARPRVGRPVRMRPMDDRWTRHHRWSSRTVRPSGTGCAREWSVRAVAERGAKGSRATGGRADVDRRHGRVLGRARAERWRRAAGCAGGKGPGDRR
jgi:hypothetical protein